MTKEQFISLKYNDVVTDRSGLEWKVIVVTRHNHKVVQVIVEHGLSRLNLAWSDERNCVVNPTWDPVEIFRPADQVA